MHFTFDAPHVLFTAFMALSFVFMYRTLTCYLKARKESIETKMRLNTLYYAAMKYVQNVSSDSQRTLGKLVKLHEQHGIAPTFSDTASLADDLAAEIDALAQATDLRPVTVDVLLALYEQVTQSSRLLSFLQQADKEGWTMRGDKGVLVPTEVRRQVDNILNGN